MAGSIDRSEFGALSDGTAMDFTRPTPGAVYRSTTLFRFGTDVAP